MSQPKVYEFAKEIGMETIALMDKIKEWKLPVKSHMAVLSEDVLVEIKERLHEETQPKKTTKKSATKKKVTKKKATKKKVTKKATTSTAANVELSSETDSKKTTKKKKIVRRKASTVIRKKKVEEIEDISLNDQPSDKTYENDDTSLEMEAATNREETPEITFQSLENKGNTSEPVDTVESLTTTPQQETVQIKEKMHAPEEQKPTDDSLSVTKEDTVASKPVKRVKRNIVGKIDLSRVKPPSSDSGSRGPSHSQKTNSNTATAGGVSANRPKRSGARSVRTGFVAPTLPEINLKEDHKRDGKTLNKKKAPAAGGSVANVNAGSGGKEVPVKTFTASDFRKREVIFQPKKKKAMLEGEMKKTQITTPKAHKRVVKINDTVKLSTLASDMGVKSGALVKILIQNGVMANMNTELDFETVSLVVPEFGFEAENVHTSVDDLIGIQAFGDLTAEPITRAPVVTIMGHVDHGKTTLLDSIRKANVVSGEAGGITQHIGAYRVNLEDGSAITFLDTPGHAAFTAMRARGAHVTDIAVIVVAADDGLMPQTDEAISHAKAAGVPIIVAVNKMDKPQANPDQVKQQLAEKELVPEDWGGETIFCHVSALKGDGIKELLEQIHLVAEMQELRSNPKRSATGVVIESAVKKGKGNVVTLLVQDGTLKVGDSIVVGKVPGRVRRMVDDTGATVLEAGPGFPVEITGLPGSPNAGDPFDVCQNDSSAAKIAQVREEKEKEENSTQKAFSIEDLLSKVKGSDKKQLSVVLKSDVVGSAEAIKGMFAKIEHPEVEVKAIHTAVGAISESDVLLASTASGLIIGFNVRPDASALNLAKQKGVEIKTYSIIYELIDDIKARLSGLLSPDVVEKAIGRAEIRETFVVPKIGTIAGCMVADGKIQRNSLVRLLRNGRVVYEGNISSLKRFKDDTKEVSSGYECGIGIENYNDLKVGDEIEAFVKEEVERTLE